MVDPWPILLVTFLFMPKYLRAFWLGCKFCLFVSHGRIIIRPGREDIRFEQRDVHCAKCTGEICKRMDGGLVVASDVSKHRFMQQQFLLYFHMNKLLRSK